jgi:hypothetical protein
LSVEEYSTIHTKKEDKVSLLLRDLFRISKIDAMGEADIIGTGRDESHINPVMTEVALPGNAHILIKGNGIVGTCLYASLASRAFFVVHDHNSIFSLLNGFLGAGIQAGGIIAVPADINPERKIQFPINHPGPLFQYRNEPDAVRCPVFLFAGNLTGLTPPARFMVDYQGMLFHKSPLYLDKAAKKGGKKMNIESRRQRDQGVKKQTSALGILAHFPASNGINRHFR